MIGTHLVDTMSFYGGDIDWVIGEGDNLDSDDPGISGFLSFKNGARGFIIVYGKRENLIFEIDVLGAQGRIRITDNGYHTEFLHFEESDRYSGYQELKRQPMPRAKPGKSPLISAIENIIDCIEKSGKPACTGEDGLKALEITVALCESARHNNQKIRF
jgi:predicted dehydrogenase